jgi:hypothetical protein
LSWTTSRASMSDTASALYLTAPAAAATPERAPSSSRIGEGLRAASLSSSSGRLPLKASGVLVGLDPWGDGRQAATEKGWRGTPDVAR